MKNTSKWLESAISTIRKHDLEISKNEASILQILHEIESRKEYSAQGFDGLYSFCIRTFGWSESQTATRTQAMYAMRAVPEVQDKIQSGTLSVTTVAQVQRYIRQEQVEAGIQRTPEEKLQVFTEFENKTSTEVKEEIAARKGERIKTKLALELDEEAEALWAEVRNLTAHQTQGSALNCFKVLMKTYLERKTKKPERPQHAVSSPSPSRRTSSSSTKVSAPRFIPAQTRREVYSRDQSQCRQCGSKHALQIDHIRPIAKGGSNDASNLQLLCRNCNLSKAIQDFGLKKMSQHVHDPRIAS